jgi:hypothetical protein
MTLPVAASAAVVRAPDAGSLADRATVPQPQDRVELTLDGQGRAMAVQASYGRTRGRIAAFQPPVLVGDSFNGAITLDDGRSFLFDYQHTRFDLVALQGPIMTYTMKQLASGLRPGQEVELTYSPPAAKDSQPRLLTVTQPSRVVFSEDYVATRDDAWRGRALAVEGLAVTDHKPEPNYLYDLSLRLLRPTAPFVPGSVTYRIAAGELALGRTALEFTARAFEDSSVVAFQVSTDDGATWTPVGRFDNTWQNCYSQQLKSLPPNIIDITEAVRGRTGFLLRMQLVVGDADQRFCVGRLAVRSESAAP